MLRPLHQFRQLGDIGRDPPRLIALARLAAVRLPFSVLLDYPGQSHFQHPKLVEILATIFTCPVGATELQFGHA